MTIEEFEKLQSEMSDIELIEKCEEQIIDLALTYGKSHKMSIPPKINDTDMLLIELVTRFKRKILK